MRQPLSSKVELYALPSADVVGTVEPALSEVEGPVQAEQGSARAASQLARTTEVTVVKRSTIAPTFYATHDPISCLSASPKVERRQLKYQFRINLIMNSPQQPNKVQEKKVYVCLSGLPLSFHLEWPFRKSTSGADFWVLHADIALENSEGLHAPVSVNLSATVYEVMTSLDPKDIEAPVINALRKEVDRRQIEFLKSGKRVPVQFSSRYYDFKRSKWVFGKATDENVALLVARKVYWQTKVAGGPVWVGDPTEALFLETSPTHLLEVAQKLRDQELLTLEGEWASANASLMAQAEKFEADMRAALAELEAEARLRKRLTIQGRRTRPRSCASVA